VGIRGEVAGGPKTLEFSPKPGKMSIRRLHNMSMRQRQPGLKLLHYMLNRERGRATTLRLVAIRSKPSIVAQASPMPSVPERQASHHRLALS
jgi:hypothetical protein